MGAGSGGPFSLPCPHLGTRSPKVLAGPQPPASRASRCQLRSGWIAVAPGDYLDPSVQGATDSPKGMTPGDLGVETARGERRRGWVNLEETRREGLLWKGLGEGRGGNRPDGRVSARGWSRAWQTVDSH